MAPAEPLKPVVVLDLDDTLYREADYRESGLKAVCRWMERLYGTDLEQALAESGRQEEKDPLGALCRLAGLPASVGESLLWIYRLHKPAISISRSDLMTIRELERRCTLAILTDGRSVTQRLKIDSLGLGHLPVYISEEHASTKPDPYRYKKIMTDLPGSRYIYVGDNPRKDFYAPNILSWETIGLIGDERNIHDQECSGLDGEHLPKQWIRSLDELHGMVF